MHSLYNLYSLPIRCLAGQENPNKITKYKIMQNKDQNDTVDDLEIQSDTKDENENNVSLSESKMRILAELVKQVKQNIETVEQLIAGSLP